MEIQTGFIDSITGKYVQFDGAQAGYIVSGVKFT